MIREQALVATLIKEMNRSSLIAVLALALFTSVGKPGAGASIQESLPSPPGAGPLRVANLIDLSMVEGCGCYFQLPAESKSRTKYVFFSKINGGGDNEKVAWMNIDGRDIKLKLVDSSRDSTRREIGMRLYRKYKAENIDVQADYIVTRVCPPSNPACEETLYKATFTVNSGARRQILKAKGSCGC